MKKFPIYAIHFCATLSIYPPSFCDDFEAFV